MTGNTAFTLLGNTQMDFTSAVPSTSIVTLVAVFNGSSSSLTVSNDPCSVASGTTLGSDTASGLTVMNRGDLGASLPGNLYGLIAINRTLTSGELADATTYMGNLGGLTL
jgi:hypothetical protein